MSTARPVVSCFNAENASEVVGKPLCLPQVFSAPLRADLVRLVHTNMNKNKRQAISVKFEAGYDTAAASWGTGRAVARIPRVPGGGTHRSGQAAFGNMCRGGGMFNPTKTWRRWHRKTNVTQKRHALAAAIAATSVPALVMARGHKVDEVPELPLVVSDAANKIAKTRDALKLLTALGASDDLERVKEGKKIRAGRGKARNRRYVMKKGPIIIHNCGKEDATEGLYPYSISTLTPFPPQLPSQNLFVIFLPASLPKSFRNIPGVDIVHVDRLNLLQLAPGGTIGRFAIYTEGAVKRLSKLFGTLKGGSSEKKGYTLPRAPMKNTDISRIINSNEVQSVLLPKKLPIRHSKGSKKNPLKNNSVLGRLCPYAPTEKRLAKMAHAKKGAVAKVMEAKKVKKEGKKKAHGKKSKEFMKDLLAAHEVKKVEVEEKGEGAEEE